MARARTLPEALAAAAQSSAGFCFVVDGVDTPRPYSDIYREALRVARSLKESGLRRGDLVALVLPDGEQFLTALFGASIAGVLPASLYPPGHTTELSRYFDATAEILTGASASAVITSGDLVHEFQKRIARGSTLPLVLDRGTMNAPAAEPDRWPTLDEPAFVQFTSGSTSTPKGVVL